MAGDSGFTHDFLSLGGDDDVATPKPSMLDKPDIQPGHAEPVVPPVQTHTQAQAQAQPDSNQSAYDKLKADRIKARQARPHNKRKADPLEAKLTNIEKQQDDISKKYAEGKGAGTAFLFVAGIILLAVFAWLFHMHGDLIIRTFKSTPWLLYVGIAIALFSFANSRN